MALEKYQGQETSLEIPVLGSGNGWPYKGKLVLTFDFLVFDGRTRAGNKKFTFSIPRENIIRVRIPSMYPFHILPPVLSIEYKDKKENYKMSLSEFGKSPVYDPFFPIWVDNETREAKFYPGWRFDRQYIQASLQNLKQAVEEREVTGENPPSKNFDLLQQSFVLSLFIPIYIITFFMGLVPAMLLGVDELTATIVGIIGGFVFAWVFCDVVFRSKLH